MIDTDAIPLFVRLVCSFFAAFPAIAIWSRSRDAAWVLLVLGALFFFVDTLYATLVMVGLTTYDLPWLPEYPILKSVLGGLPLILLSVGFLVYIFRNRRY